MRRARIESAVAMAYTAHSVLARLKEKVAKLSSSAVTARTRSRELEDAWERINELCKERGAQARAGSAQHSAGLVGGGRTRKSRGYPPLLFRATNPVSLLRPADVFCRRRQSADCGANRPTWSSRTKRCVQSLLRLR